MKEIKSQELKSLSDDDLTKRLNELRSELSKLQSSAARGTLKKELGEIKTVRRNIARVLTSMNSRKTDQGKTQVSRSKPSSPGSEASKDTSSESKSETGGKEG